METTSTDDTTLKEKVSELSDRIDLQGSDVDRSFYQEKCTKCPANDGVVYVMHTSRHQLYCALQAALLNGDIHEAALISSQVEGSFEGDPKCSPNQGGKRIKELIRLLEEEPLAI
jgi:hypothetical protein